MTTVPFGGAEQTAARAESHRTGHDDKGTPLEAALRSAICS
ncbi:hypothetical protein [Nocardioides sp.]